MAPFLAVNALFVIGFIGLIVVQPALWVWVLFVAAWCAADWLLARDIHLAWWHWALLIIALTAIDLIVLRAMGHI